MSSPTTAVTSAPEPLVNVIAMSPNYATGLVMGIFLLFMLAFAVVMMMAIQTSDKMALPDNVYKLPEKKED